MGKTRLEPARPPVTLFLIPGGPGLSPRYMRRWALAAARTFSGRVVEIDYGLFARASDAAPGRRLASALRALSSRVRRAAPRGERVLVAHSFGARIAVELLRSSPGAASAAILLDCPADFEPSRSYVLKKRRLSLPAVIRDERDFRRYWRAVLPLFFHCRPKPEWIDGLARDTSWIKTDWLSAPISGAPKGLPAPPPMLFVHGTKDERFPASNATRLRSAFPGARHAFIRGSGHFPMLEDPRALTAELISFLRVRKLVDLQRASCDNRKTISR